MSAALRPAGEAVDDDTADGADAVAILGLVL
jgi:hypothetical protein